ncbi:hypothetical protein RRF57_009811 [Xylaria bambusicola]|uniref:Uncharacterized protein n=1 Tax=Xylaria bambusicola TaxID=326684 RepID=A0AAN7Z842_9PEZI
MVLSAARALCSTFDISSRDTFKNIILPPSKTFTPIPYNLSTIPIRPCQEQKIIILEFSDALANIAQSFGGIFWGSSLSNVTEVRLGVPDGVGILDKAANYSTACSNATTIFNSTLIFLNCLRLGFTSVLLDGGVISLNEDSVQTANSYLSFGDIRSFNGSGVLDDITTCISATCQDTRTNTCGWEVTSNLTEAYDPKYNVTEKLKRLYMGFNAYCDGQIVQPNSDVLGPGVLIASFTQVAAVSFFFIFSKFHRWARRLKAWHQRPWTWSGGKAYVSTLGYRADPSPKPNGVVRALARFSTAIESVLVDFHEAQILFLLTIQLATLWFFDGTKVMENSNTYAEANATYIWAKGISIFGILPVLLGQTVLQRSGRHWWYTTLLTTIAAVVALVVDATSRDLDYAAFWTKLKNEDPISQCGGNPSPNTYCRLHTKIFQPTVATAQKDIAVMEREEFRFVFIFMTISAPAFLLVDQLFIWIRGLELWNRVLRFCKRASHWDKLSKSTQSSINKASRLFVWAMWTIHQSLLLISLVPIFSYLLFLFHAFTPLAGGWSYGQLVASLIWAPLGLKLAYYTFCKEYSDIEIKALLTFIVGVEKGVENRIGGQFQVQGKHDIDPLVTQAEKTRHKKDAAEYVSVTDLRSELEISPDDWYQKPKYANIQSHIYHSPRKPSLYFPIPQEH